MRRSFQIGTVVAAHTVSSGFTHAHHSQAGAFDSRKAIEVVGVVKSVSWHLDEGA